MRHKSEKGGSIIEFAFITLTLVPLLCGIGVIGINLIRTLQTEQLARDAGHMYARGVDFTATGNQQILANIAGSLNLSTTAGSGDSVVTFSALTYVDSATCALAGYTASGSNNGGCNNYGKWVFTQRLVIGNSSIRSSNLGSPLTSGPNSVTVNSTTGKIALSDYATKAGAVAQFNAINPYSNVAGTVTGLPSGQVLYIAEASASEYSVPPYTGGGTYAFGLF